MSKSKGNVVDPVELINLYGKDALRFYLANNIITGEDGKFSRCLLEETINGLLVNKYSNLVARTDSMVKKFFESVVPSIDIKYKQTDELKLKLNSVKEKYFEAMDEYRFSDSTKLLISYVEELNSYIDITKPWKAEGEELKAIINTLVNEIYNITLMLSSILLDSSTKVFAWLGKKDNELFTQLDTDFAGTKLNEIEHLFTRIDKEKN